MALPLAKIDLHVRWPFIAPFVALSAAVVLSLLSRWCLPAFGAIFGSGWLGAIRHQLIDWGVSTQFVTGYVSFALLHLPQWAVLAGITFALGLTHSRRAHQFAWLLSVAVPLSDVLIAALGSSAYGLHGAPTHLAVRVYCLIPGFGALIGVAAWWAGYLLRGRRGRGTGYCTACGYDLRASDSAACPECGHIAKNPAI